MEVDEQLLYRELRVCAPGTDLIMFMPAVAGFASLSSTEATGINIYKQGSDPQLKPDEELPDWLFNLERPAKSLSELRRIAKDKLELDDVCHASPCLGLLMPAHITNILR
jgi:Mitochondrial ribosomal protein L37